MRNNYVATMFFFKSFILKLSVQFAHANNFFIFIKYDISWHESLLERKFGKNCVGSILSLSREEEKMESEKMGEL